MVKSQPKRTVHLRKKKGQIKSKSKNTVGIGHSTQDANNMDTEHAQPAEEFPVSDSSLLHDSVCKIIGNLCRVLDAKVRFQSTQVV